MNRYDYAYYALGCVIGAVIGSLASQADYGFWGWIAWIAGTILLVVLYGEANSARRSARTKTRR